MRNKKFLSDKVAEVNLLQMLERILHSGKRARDEQKLTRGPINALYRLRNEILAYSSRILLISAYHNSDVGHW